MTEDLASTTPGESVAVVTLAELQADPLGFLERMTSRYGDAVRYVVDGQPTVLVNRPDYIRQVLQDGHRNYVKLGTPELLMLRPILGEGLLTSEGESWARQRRLVQPAFHRSRVEGLGRMMVELTLKTLDDWAASPGDGGTLDIEAEMSQLTLAIVAKALFGSDISREAPEFGRAVRTINLFMGHFDPRDAEGRKAFAAALGTLDGLVANILRQREIRRKEGTDGEDLLDMLLALRDGNGGALSDRELRDQVITFLMAGHETTAKAITWTLYLLDCYPDAQRRLRTELDQVLRGRSPEVQDIPLLSYTWMALQESMRLFPPVWIVSRRAVEVDEIGGVHVPAGALVLVSPYLMHRHPDHWSEPQSFRPERFHPDVQERSPYVFLPFSGGPRHCIGKIFASLETRLVVATILQRFQLSLVEGHTVEPEALVTLRPRHGMPMILHGAVS